MSSEQDMVVVIHGYASHWLIMEPLRYRLTRRGFDAVSWSYRSLWTDTQPHADRLRDHLAELDQSGVSYHIVAHSMGSIVTRAALLESKATGLGRIVFITPPDHRLAGRTLCAFVYQMDQSGGGRSVRWFGQLCQHTAAGETC